MKFLLTLITFLAFYVTSFAAPISKEVAREKAARFIASKTNGNSAARSALRNGGSIVFGASLTAVDNQEAYYVFNVDSSNGYIIVSGDDRMPDVLGYSYSGSYNRGSIPDNMKAWLQGYADEYQYLQSHSDAKAASLTSVTGDAILPMIPTHWGQSYPYNIYCPLIGSSSTLTGCVATVMSQVMYYHQWPKQTTKKIPAYTTKTASISMPNIAVTTIDWDNMSPAYGGVTETMNKAVANIMLLAGCSVKMDYGIKGSGAPVAYIKDALQDYFDYKNTITYIQRDNYGGSQDAWNQMVYDELKNNRPVIYGGVSSQGGHAFVIDGYDENDLFHVNWGWGHSDGYFLLNVFDEKNAYTTNQEAVFGIEGKGNPEHKYAYAVLDDDVLTFYYDNNRESHPGTMLDIDGFPWMRSAEYQSTITKIVIDDSFKDYKYLTTAKMMFAEMSNLTTIEGLTNLNTQNVTDMYGMFYNCQNIDNLDFSNFDTKSVTNMYYMFCGCTNLSSLNLSSFDTRNVTNMNGMFFGCEKLDSLDLSNFDTKNVSDMFGMFYACQSLTFLDLSGFDTKNVTDMSWMFASCQNVEKIYVDEKWTTENVQSSNHMFNGCWYLVGQDGTEYDYYKDDATYAHYKEDGYLSCWPKAYAVLENDTLTFYYDILKPEREGTVLSMDKFEWTGETYRNNITTVDFDAAFEDYQGLTSTAMMFSRMENLTTINGLKYLNTENVTDMSAMFSGCQSLTSIDVSTFDTQNVTDMSWMFGVCQNLKTLDLGSFDTGNVTKMNAMFSGCENLDTLYIDGFNTENVTKMNSMFAGCKKLVAPNFSNFNTERVEDMNAMFSDCQAITSLDVSTFDTKNVTKMNGMFSGCNTLDTLDLSKFDTKNVTRMDNMFKECLELTTIFVGDDWNMESVENSKGMFLDCSSIVGQDGTTYDADSTDKAKAHYDEGGYLTYKPLYLRGDANGDGVVDREDVKFIADIILGVQEEEYDLKAADANGDGVINMPDIMFIVNYILNGKFPEPEEEEE